MPKKKTKKLITVLGKLEPPKLELPKKTTARKKATKKVKVKVKRTLSKTKTSLLKKIAKKTKKPRVVKAAKHQTGKIKSLDRDEPRKAMKPGKRISKKGKVYYEYRKNRSDLYKTKKGWI